MEKKITLVKPGIPRIARRDRVAAYARVSSGKDAMLHSMSAQVSYYSDLIQSVPEWSYAGVYTDEAFTGTKDDREGFRRMLDDCRAGKIDRVITKSVSRFARNTLTLLNTVRELKQLGVDVYFEEQNIHSMSGDGELMLTILASFAQEESRSVSENCKWRVRLEHEEGNTYGWNFMYGYRIRKGEVSIEEEEARVVRWVFDSYINGTSAAQIARTLREQSVPTCRGGTWDHKRVLALLKNEKYCGDSLLQKKYVEDHLTKKLVLNHGELPSHYVEDSHPAIIPREMYQRAQSRIRANHQRCHISKEAPVFSALTGKIVCERCGKHYRRKISAKECAWNCATYLRLGKDACAGRKIPEDTIMALAAQVLGLAAFDEQAFKDRVREIRVVAHDRLSFVFNDGAAVEREWGSVHGHVPGAPGPKKRDAERTTGRDAR